MRLSSTHKKSREKKGKTKEYWFGSGEQLARARDERRVQQHVVLEGRRKVVRSPQMDREGVGCQLTNKPKEKEKKKEKRKGEKKTSIESLYTNAFKLWVGSKAKRQSFSLSALYKLRIVSIR